MTIISRSGGASKGFDSYTSKDELNQSDQGFFLHPGIVAMTVLEKCPCL